MINIKLDDLIWKYRTKACKIINDTGISGSTISKMRNNKNKNLSMDTLNKLCKYFDCKISDLLEYTPE